MSSLILFMFNIFLLNFVIIKTQTVICVHKVAMKIVAFSITVVLKCDTIILYHRLHRLFLQGTVFTQMTDGASSPCNTVLRIYQATFFQNIINIGQNLTKLLEKYRRSSFYWDTV